MAPLRRSALFALIAPHLFPHGTLAQSDTEIVWSSVIVTRNGDSIPLISNDPTTLTPLGAQQLYSAGALFRERYIESTSTGNGTYTIPGISTYQIDNTQTFALAALEEYVVDSAQAFIQGLYPPLANTLDNPSALYTPESLLANGTNVAFPLGGYQYPFIYATSPLDPNSIWIAGQVNCNGFIESGSQYFSSSQYLETSSATQDFYQSVAASVFGGELPASDIDYHNAYYIFDYINYGYTHNETISAAISAEQLFQFRTLADQWEYAINGNQSASGFYTGDRVRTIAGQALAAEILGLLINNVENAGGASMINLLFTTFDPMISLASLLGLPEMYTQFYGLPGLGSSMVFEMYSVSNSTNPSYPDPANLQVRFLFRNGTNSSTNLDEYPIFGNTETRMSMSLGDFTAAMEAIMMATVGSWCTVCQSNSVFCPGFVNVTTVVEGGSGDSHSSSGVSPVVAGVIGAVVTLTVASIILAIAMLVFGVRFIRTRTKRRSDLGGFKGAEKLASDTDLTLGSKGGMGATVIGKDGTKAHERVGSWEMGESSRTKDFGSLETPGEGRPSFERDGESVHELGAVVKDREVV